MMSPLITQLEVLRLTLLYLAVADVLVRVEHKIILEEYWWKPEWVWYPLWPFIVLCYLPALGSFLLDSVQGFVLGPLDEFFWWIEDKLDGVSPMDCDCFCVGFKQCTYHSKMMKRWMRRGW
jgi:hypothetical protein